MSYRSRNTDVSLTVQSPIVQVHVDREMHQVMDVTVNSSVLPNSSVGYFLPEASITMPYAGSVAAVSVRTYGQGVSGGKFAVSPFTKQASGSGFVMASGSTGGVFKYPKSLIPFFEKDVLQLSYSSSVDYFGPSGSCGFRFGLWVWQ